MRRTQPTYQKAKIYSTTHVQLLQWLHGKQQYQQQLNNLDTVCPGSRPERMNELFYPIEFI